MIITVLKSINISVINVVSPGRVVKTKISDKTIGEGEMKESSSYIAVYLFFLVIGWIIMSFYTHNPINALFDVTSTIGNVGLSTGVINGSLDTVPKVMLIFLMWIGRLEIIPILLTLKLGYGSFKQSLKLIKRSL